MNRINFIKQGFMALLGITTVANSTPEEKLYTEEEITGKLNGASCKGDSIVKSTHDNITTNGVVQTFGSDMTTMHSDVTIEGNTILKGNVYIEVSPGKYRKL